MNALLSAALRYSELGYAVFPCVPGKKVPIKDSNGCHDATTDSRQIEEWWNETPDANIAIATKGLLVVDVDGDGNPFLSSNGSMGDPPISATPRGGWHFVYRLPEGKRWANTSGSLAPRVDIRTTGGYILVEPSVFEGKRYQWAETFRLDRPPSDLPLPPDWLIERLDQLPTQQDKEDSDFPEEGNDILDGQLSGGVGRKKTLLSQGGTMRDAGMTYEEILAALHVVNRNRCKPPLPDKEVERVAKKAASYEPNQFRTAAVEHHADRNGVDLDFIIPQRVTTELLPAPQIPEEDLEEPEDGTLDHDDPGPLPLEDMRVPGFVSHVLDHTMKTAPYPNQPLAFAGALALMATLSGRKVRDIMDVRSNIYLLALAPPGAGKDHPRKVNAEILMEAGLITCLSNKFASGEGLEDALAVEPCKLFQTDEIDNVLQSLRTLKEGRAESIISTLLTLYSSANTIYRLREKAARKDKETASIIDQPHLVLLGTAIPSHFYAALTEKFLTNGLVARMIVLEAEKRGKGQEPEPKSIPKKIRDLAKWWAAYRPDEGNLAHLHPGPRIVHSTREAQAVFAEARERVEGHYGKAECVGDAVSAAIWGRTLEHARKLALLYAVSEDNLSPEIGGKAASWGARVALHQARRMLYMASRYSAENRVDSGTKKILRIIGQNARKEIPHSRLLKAMKIDTDSLTRLVDTLVDRGDIEAITIPQPKGKPGRKKRLYRLCGKAARS